VWRLLVSVTDCDALVGPSFSLPKDKLHAERVAVRTRAAAGGLKIRRIDRACGLTMSMISEIHNDSCTRLQAQTETWNLFPLVAEAWSSRFDRSLGHRGSDQICELKIAGCNYGFTATITIP
jgi:hypothetical protein